MGSTGNVIFIKKKLTFLNLGYQLVFSGMKWIKKIYYGFVLSINKRRHKRELYIWNLYILKKMKESLFWIAVKGNLGP